MNLDDVDFEAEWERFKKVIGKSLFALKLGWLGLRYLVYTENSKGNANRRVDYIDRKIVDVWISMGLIENAGCEDRVRYRINPEHLCSM